MYARYFSISCLCAGTGAYEILHVPFKTTVSFSYCLLALSDLSATGFQSQALWGLIFPGWGAQRVAQTLHSSGKAPHPMRGSPGLGCGPDQTVSLPLLPISGWCFLYILSCVRSFLLVLRSFSEIVVLNVVVVLVCLSEEVSSGSSSSAIWILPSARFHFLLL